MNHLYQNPCLKHNFLIGQLQAIYQIEFKSFELMKQQATQYIGRLVYWNGKVVGTKTNSLLIKMNPGINKDWDIELQLPQQLKINLLPLKGENVDFVAQINNFDNNRCVLTFKNVDIYSREYVLFKDHLNQIRQFLLQNNPLPKSYIEPLITQALTWPKYLIDCDPLRYQQLFNHCRRLMTQFNLYYDGQIVISNDGQRFQLNNYVFPKKGQYKVIGLLRQYSHNEQSQFIIEIVHSTVQYMGKMLQSFPTFNLNRFSICQEECDKQKLLEHIGVMQQANLNAIQQNNIINIENYDDDTNFLQINRLNRISE
ncbi:Hypothetical_protein [Hexamita inflata]|uniref:Hypothetical_protein n=1 Tax=Hexamita inflata TaxID=28002 RepID=A0AA86PW50_9EUKA|nr:Hypothetical protein HINF_LOCUS33748 [Hexamita inflata]